MNKYRAELDDGLTYLEFNPIMNDLMQKRALELNESRISQEKLSNTQETSA